MASRSRAVYRSGELARAAGVSPDTVRHYERMGLLESPRRLENGYRQYAPATLKRVLLIRQALAHGFTLAELGPILRSRAAGRPPCHRVRALAGMKLEVLEARLGELARLRDALQATLARWDRKLARVPEGREVRLLESLATRPPSAEAVPFPARRPVRRLAGRLTT